MIEHDEIKLTTVKVLKELYQPFQKISIDENFSLQKFVNRAMEKFLIDEEFRNEIILRDTVVSGSYKF